MEYAGSVDIFKAEMMKLMEALDYVREHIEDLLVITRVIVGNSTTSSQLEAGSIMVRDIKSIDEPFLPLRVYGPIRSTHRASQGMHITILDGRCPYFSDCFLFTWQIRMKIE